MTLDELQAKLPAEMQPWVAEYGPQIVAMSVQAVKDLIDQLLAGDTAGAYKTLIAGMVAEGPAAVAAERKRLLIEGVLLNKSNAEAMAWQRTAAQALGRILLTLLLAVAGF